MKSIKLFYSEILAILLIFAFPFLTTETLDYIYGEGKKSVNAEVGGISLITLIFYLILIIYVIKILLKVFVLKRQIFKHDLVNFLMDLAVPVAVYLWALWLIFSPSHLLLGFYIAVTRGDQVRAERFLQMGVNINEVYSVDGYNKDKYSVLILSSGMGKTEMVRFLLDKGANREYKDTKGKTALDYAESRKYSEVAELLKK